MLLRFCPADDATSVRICFLFNSPLVRCFFSLSLSFNNFAIYTSPRVLKNFIGRVIALVQLEVAIGEDQVVSLFGERAPRTDN